MRGGVISFLLLLFSSTSLKSLSPCSFFSLWVLALKATRRYFFIFSLRKNFVKKIFKNVSHWILKYRKKSGNILSFETNRRLSTRLQFLLSALYSQTRFRGFFLALLHFTPSRTNAQCYVTLSRL